MVITVKEFLKACADGDSDEFLRKLKSGRLNGQVRAITEQEYQRALRRLLSDLRQQNVASGIIEYVSKIIEGNISISQNTPKQPDAPRLSNASTPTQPLRVIVNWTAPNDGGSEIISYDLYRSELKGQKFAAIQKNIPGLTFTDTLPSEGTWHYYVVATNSIGKSDSSFVADIIVRRSGEGRKTDYTEEKIQDHKTLGIHLGASKSEINSAFREEYKKIDPSKGSQHRTKLEQEKLESKAKKLLEVRERLLKK